MTPAALLSELQADPTNVALRLAYADSLEESGDLQLAIMQRIIAEPGEDRWRLDYAAELERTAGTVVCEKCCETGTVIGGHLGDLRFKCKTCEGAGRVSDGRAEWAEFIRVQCELARMNICPAWCDPKDETCERRILERRERELWPAVRPMFGYEVQSYWCGSFADRIEVLPAVVVQRGFPSVVRCTLAEWMGGECGRCGPCSGTHRGIGTVDCPREPHHHCDEKCRVTKRCTACHGTGHAPGIGPRLAQGWPIERVETEKQPMHNGREFLWLKREDRPGIASLGSAALPASVFDLLTGYREYIRDGQAKCYPTESAARDALSAACIQWARKHDS